MTETASPHWQALQERWTAHATLPISEDVDRSHVTLKSWLNTATLFCSGQATQ